MVFFEAMALHRPVIATAIAGMPELVRPGVNGWLVPAGSIEALVGALRGALARPAAELEPMGRAGTALVAERFCAATEAGKLAALFEAAAAASPPGNTPPGISG